MGDGPLVAPDSHPSLGPNLNGPSLIRVPEWVPRPLGRYYLYFAAHHGSYIRLAYADDVAGPYTVHPPGALRLDQTRLTGHIASPDVHVDDEHERIVMFHHGGRYPGQEHQTTCLATSKDGLAFDWRDEPLGRAYWRVFRHGGWFHAVEMSGRVRRARELCGPYAEGATLVTGRWRHCAVHVAADTLHVFLSTKGDAPEHIQHATVDLARDEAEWSLGPRSSLLLPERNYEGGDLVVGPSSGGPAPGRVRQLRDPCVYIEDGLTYLLYSVAGESGIAAARIEW